jgi:hypothetical protein
MSSASESEREEEEVKPSRTSGRSKAAAEDEAPYTAEAGLVQYEGW